MNDVLSAVLGTLTLWTVQRRWQDGAESWKQSWKPEYPVDRCFQVLISEWQKVPCGKFRGHEDGGQPLPAGFGVSGKLAQNPAIAIGGQGSRGAWSKVPGQQDGGGVWTLEESGKEATSPVA